MNPVTEATTKHSKLHLEFAWQPGVTVGPTFG